MNDRMGRISTVNRISRLGGGICIVVATASLAWTFAACSDDSTGAPADFFQAEMWPSTHQMAESEMAQIVSMDDDGTIVFTADSAIAASLAPRHVLMAGETTKTPRGMLRLVKSVTPVADGIEVKTEQAALQHAFKSLHTKFTRPVRLDSADIIWDTAPGAKILDSTENRQLVRRESGGTYVGPFTIDYYPFNGDSDDSSNEDQIHVVATFGGGIEYQFGIDFDWPDVDDVLTGDPLPEIVVGYAVKAGAEASLDVEGVAMLSYDRQDTLGHAYLGGFWIGPLYFTVSVDLLSKIEGGASSRFLMTTGAGANFETAAQYSTDDGGRLVPPTADYWGDAPSITATENAFIKASIGPRLRLALYDVFGPHVSVWAYGELSADSERDPCWDLRVGVYGDIGIDLTIWGETIADWTEPFDIWDTSIASGQCVPDPDAPEVPDLIDPLFTPWSMFVLDTVVSWDLDRSFSSIEPTVDGHWLIAGSGSNTLSKVTNDGSILWNRQYTRVNATIPMAMSVNQAINTRDLGIFATTYSPMMLLDLDADGGVVRAWRPDVEFQPVDGLQVMTEDDQGNIFVGGPYQPQDMGQSDAWIFKVAPDGTVLWSKTWGREDISEWVTGFVRLGADLVVVGESFGLAQDPAHQSFAMRLTPEGETVWITEIKGGPGTDGVALRKAVISSDGDIIAGGSYGLGGPDQILVKIKPDGSLGWVNGNRSGGLGIDLTDMFQLTDGGYMMTGLWWTGGDDHIWVARTDSVGRMNWLKKYQTPVDSGCPSIAMTGDGGAMVTAYTYQGVDRKSTWVSRLPIKTGDITLNPTLATMSDESFTTDQNPSLVLTASPVSTADRPFNLVSDVVTSELTSISATPVSQ